MLKYKYADCVTLSFAEPSEKVLGCSESFSGKHARTPEGGCDTLLAEFT
jgi:hypothetical protein